VRNLSVFMAIPILLLAVSGAQGQTPAKPAVTAPAKKELPSFDLVEHAAFPLDHHLESKDLAAGMMKVQNIYEDGAKLFHTPYNGLDGVGVRRLPNGTPALRFSPVPIGGGMLTSPSSQACGSCHAFPYAASAGLAHTDLAFDPGADGLPPFNIRSTTSLFGDGLLQLLAQEITEQLQAQRDRATEAAAKSPGKAVRQELRANNVRYGVLVATADETGKISLDLSGLEGVDPDLVVRPFGWKGNITSLRSNTIGPANFVMGMQPEEFVWKAPDGGANADPDGDGVTRELSVGDITAMVVYTASQETPQPVSRLVELGMIAAPDAATMAKVEKGRALFQKAGCTSCHLPEMHLANTVFEEPTTRGNGNYYDHMLAAKDKDYDPTRPVRFDLLGDSQPPHAARLSDGGAQVLLYGDLKRHHMGRQLADPGGPAPPIISDFAPLQMDGKVVLIPATDFLTAELWGVGNTGPYLHDARAGTLEEAVLLHGEDKPTAAGDPGRSEAQEARDAFAALSKDDRAALVTFLRSLLTFSPQD